MEGDVAHAPEQVAHAQQQAQSLSKKGIKKARKLQGRAELRETTKNEKRDRHEQRKQLEAAAAAAAAAAAPARTPRAPFALSPAAAGERAYAFWRRIGAPRTVLAPMVHHSELAFRLLARQHGAPLVYTQMLHSASFATQLSYRADNFELPHPADRPLVAQFCGDDPATIEAAALQLQASVDAIDLNCGCPQGIAKRGHYGAFLLDEPDLIVSIVRHLSATLDVPVCVKIRVLPDPERTLALALALQEAGCVLLTVHGRTRAQMSRGSVDWPAISALKAALTIPVIANGGVESPEDIEACLAATRCDAVMLSEAALENPAIFEGASPSRAGQLALAREYLALAREHRPPTSIVKSHLFKFLFIALREHVDLRTELGSCATFDELSALLDTLGAREERLAAEAPEGVFGTRCDCAGAPFLTWYRRHRPDEQLAGDAATAGGRVAVAAAAAGAGAAEREEEGACCEPAPSPVALQTEAGA
jgi:tRNA-dihydrouridine synthase 1